MISYLLLAVLFFILSPGVILTLPPTGKFQLYSEKTSITSAFIHAILFGIILYIIDINQERFAVMLGGTRKKPFTPADV